MNANRPSADPGKPRKNEKSRGLFGLHYRFALFLALGSLSLLFSCSAKSSNWEEKVLAIVWVAYSPPATDPSKGVEASADSIREDLAVLRKAGFTGLVTYSSSGLLGRDLVGLAKAQGFQGVILGVWDPASQAEIAAAKAAGNDPLVLGFCVGNEGLRQRYQLSTLTAAIEELRKAVGKPVTTTEVIEEYSDESFLQLGDWVFPNAHPYFHNQLDPQAAIRWTQAAFEDFKKRSPHLVIFKEVGLPTAGDPQNRLSEAAQEQYYVGLARTGVKFVYFEAFDQPWKTHLPVEPHWGIYNSDRTPKRLASLLMGATRLPSPASEPPFYVYRDADSTDNHFKPTGYMGDIGDIHIDEAYGEKPYSGKTCIRIVYDAKGKSPNSCSYSPPCKWSGVYWQEPPNNWGKESFWKDKGFNLSPYNRLMFWAKADREGVVEFKVGGLNEIYGDSLLYPRTQNARLSKDWQEFEVNLSGADLKHIIGGFCWASNWERSPGGITIYLDEIRFQKK